MKNGAKLCVLERIENVTKPWVVAGHVDEAVRSALRKALLNLDDKKSLEALKIDGFVTGHDRHYASVRSAIEASRQF